MARPALSTVAELLKPITWFPPMWAFGCGVVASGVPTEGRWPIIVIGVVLAGPMVCASSQAVNDWFDRHVDAINEPQRPIPSGRMPGRWGLGIAICAPSMGAILEVQVLPRADHSERSEAQLREGDRAWGGSVERNRESRNTKRI